MAAFYSMSASVVLQPDFLATSDWLTKAIDSIKDFFDSFVSWITNYSPIMEMTKGSAWYFLILIFFWGQLYFLYILVSLPLRRQERARLFLDLLETGLKEGRSVEENIVSLSNSRDQTLGVWFHLLAARLELGLTFIEGLKKTPRFLPQPLVAMLEAGSRIGNISKVLPASRKLLTDGNSRSRVLMNHVIVLMITSSTLNVWLFLSGRLFEKPMGIFWDMSNDFSITNKLPVLVHLVFERTSMLTIILQCLTVFLWLSLFLYLGGQHWIPRFLRIYLKPWSDRLFYHIPWCRKRLKRDFSSILAVLLDAEMPEEQAITLAAQGTGNDMLVRQASMAVEELQQGMTLTQVMRHFDDRGEFQWRLANVCHAGSGFLDALSGWHEILDAKAFQGEQVASQIITTFLVLLNAIIVGSITIGMFQLLILIIQEGVLW